MSVTIQGQVGPRTVADGANTEFRQGRTGAIINSDGHGRYHESVSRGLTFSISTVLAGTTVVSGNVSPVAAAAATILSLYNPIGSGVNASVLKVVFGQVSGTPGAGMVAYNIAYNQTITAAANAATVCNYASGKTGACKGFTQTALTGSGAQVLLRPLGPLSFAGALAVGAGPLGYLDEVAGEIVLPPGGLLSIAVPAAGTTWVLAGSMTYEEVPTSPV